MSGRGRGRGGGRGGRGGKGGRQAPAGLPGWDHETTLLMNGEPQDTYPKFYKPPVAPPLTPLESRSISSLIAFRRAFHDTPLYTHRHLNSETTTSASAAAAAAAAAADPVPRLYGQSQINARFGVKNRATVDPFLAVPMYSHRFVDELRSLPDLKDRPYVREFFPEELWSTLDGRDKGGPRGGYRGGYRVDGREKRGLKRRGPTAADNDHNSLPEWDHHGQQRRRRHDGPSEPETEEERKRRIAEAAEKGQDNDDGDGGGGGGGGGGADVDLDEEDKEMSQEDDDYEDDEDGGDYDAEQYFDDGADNDFEDDGAGETGLEF